MFVSYPRSTLHKQKQASAPHKLLITYLENILKHPKQLRYRQLKLSNAHFEKVWHSGQAGGGAGARSLLCAVGFKEHPGDFVELAPLTDSRKRLVRIALAELKGMQDYAFWVD